MSCRWPALLMRPQSPNREVLRERSENDEGEREKKVCKRRRRGRRGMGQREREEILVVFMAKWGPNRQSLFGWWGHPSTLMRLSPRRRGAHRRSHSTKSLFFQRYSHFFLQKNDILIPISFKWSTVRDVSRRPKLILVPYVPLEDVWNKRWW